MGLISWICKIFKGYETCDIIEELKINYASLKEEYEELKKKYEEDVAYYESRIKKLLKLLEKSIQLPTIKLQETPEEMSNITLYNIILEQVGELWDFATADVSYWAVSREEFERILRQVNEKIKATWTEEIFDCDDFALLMAGLLAYTCYKSGFKKQLAFGIGWSNIHAFNIFVDKNYTVWIWEPQLAKTVGKAIDYKNDQTYGIRYVWFMG